MGPLPVTVAGIEMMPDRTPYQERIIKNYYKNRDAIALQRLAELVTELYLSQGKARARQWKHVAAAMEKLGIAKARIDHLVQQDNPALVARVIEEINARGK